jgi:hypothetical protein
LFVLLAANRETEPWPADDWASAYQVVVAVINGGPRAVAAGRAQDSFAVYKHGSPLACSGQAESLVYPDYVMPGAVETVRAPLSCAPAEAGDYDVVGRLQFEGSAEDVEAGRFALQVAHDPLRYTPIPDPFLYPRPLRP